LASRASLSRRATRQQSAPERTDTDEQLRQDGFGQGAVVFGAQLMSERGL
jgi:hypothetical protein